MLFAFGELRWSWDFRGGFRKVFEDWLESVWKVLSRWGEVYESSRRNFLYLDPFLFFYFTRLELGIKIALGWNWDCEIIKSLIVEFYCREILWKDFEDDFF